MKSNKLYTIFLLLIASVNVAAQDSVKLSMQEVFTAIDNSYPQLKYYDAKIASIRSLVDGAKAWMPPTVSLAFDRFPYRLSLIKEMMPDNQAGMMVSVQQMIPNAAKLNAKKDYLGSLENVQRNDAEWQRNTLHFTARLYYYRRFIAENKLRTIQQYRDLLKILIQTAKDKYTYNQSDLPAIFKGEAALSELENMETMSLAQIAESNIGLNTLMSRDVNAPFAIDTLLLPVDYRADYLMVNDTSALLRNDILSMESRIRSMKFNQKWAATGSRPDFGVQISHGQMFGMPNQFSIMGMMTIPIVPWSSKMYKSDVRSMEFEIDAMRKEKSTMQLMATQMVREKITMLLYETRQLDNYDKNVVPSYKKNLESNLLAYRQNTGNFFVLLDAWNMLLMKELERTDKLGQVFTIQSEYEYQREIK
ncbi:TolC family protein [Olivibacter sp. XZL3]|uniref:TolC family protein n=1 Tax=Olivibacter sp. XZL3 TaxID=1735116 RepID=UPI001065E9FF|nr:TolC family protein [Olivibacter sp. XZL3]